MTQQTTDAAPLAAGTTMRAAVAQRFGGPEVVTVERVPKPVAGPGEVLVRLHASTVSIADHRIRSKDLPAGLGFLAVVALGVFRPRTPILGMEGAGVDRGVAQMSRRSQPGDRGDRAPWQRDGLPRRVRDGPRRSHRSRGCRRACPSRMPPPSSSAAITALSFLDRVDLRPGVEVLVNGASGAVGTAVVQLASHAGARVTAVCSAAQRGTGPLPRRGARHRLRAGGLRGRRRPIRRRRRMRRQRAVRSRPRHPEARWCAAAGDRRPPLDARGAPARRRRSGMLVTHTGSALGASVLRDLVARAEAGEIRPVIDRTYALDDIVEAHRYVDTGRKRGSVVVRIP